MGQFKEQARDYGIGWDEFTDTSFFSRRKMVPLLEGNKSTVKLSYIISWDSDGTPTKKPLGGISCFLAAPEAFIDVLKHTNFHSV